MFVCLFKFLAVLDLRCYVLAFSSCGEWGHPVVEVQGLLTVGASLVEWCRLWWSWHVGSGVGAHGSRSLGSVVWHMGLAAPRHTRSSRTMDGTAVPCIARWALNPWATREALLSQIFNVSPRFVIAFLLRNKCLDFMATATIHSDFGTQEKKICPSFHFLPAILTSNTSFDFSRGQYLKAWSPEENLDFHSNSNTYSVSLTSLSLSLFSQP